MEKYKRLFKDIKVLALSNFGSKVLAFLLVPLYTSVLSTEEYGDYDIIYTTISLLAPILTVNIAEGALRFLLEKESRKSQIISITFTFNILSIFIVATLLAVNSIYNLIPAFKEYSVLFLLLYITFSLYQTEQNITRGLDKLKQIGIGGLINSVLVLVLNIAFLVFFKMGIRGFFMANIIAYAITTVYLFFAGKTYAYFERGAKRDKKTKTDLVAYSRPMMLNSISWWVNSVSDRYLVTLICGAAANGVYSMSYKIPTILTMVQSIFNQAWTISSTKSYDKDDKNNYFANIYMGYNLLLTVVCSLLIACTKFLATILYKNEFFEAWEYMPFLLISVVFSSLAGVLSGVFVAVKDSKLIGYTSFVGAVINIIFNIVLISVMGPIGAAIATLISSLAIWIMRYAKAKKYIKLESINVMRDCLSYGLLLAQSVVLFYIGSWHVIIVEAIILLAILALYSRDIAFLFNKMIKYKREKK